MILEHIKITVPDWSSDGLEPIACRRFFLLSNYLLHIMFVVRRDDAVVRKHTPN